MLNILGVGTYHPETVIDNAFLESLDIGTSNDWIIERVGIAERRTILPLDYIRDTRNADPRAAVEAATMTLKDIGTAAAKQALACSAISPNQIGLVINGMSVPQMCIPANGCLIAAELGIQAPTIDLNSACSTFSAQVHFLNGMKEESLPDFILLIQSETYTPTISYNDRNTAVLFGDGASAMILSPRHKGKATILCSSFDSNPSAWDKVYTPIFRHFYQEGSAVQRFAIQKTVDTAKKLRNNIEFSNNSYFIGHQANLRMLESSCTRLGVDEKNHYSNITVYGNCGGAGAPSVLAENWDRFKPGDDLTIVTVGSGLSWGGTTIQFGEV